MVLSQVSIPGHGEGKGRKWRREAELLTSFLLGEQ
jgi:hypothetical protein